MRITLCRAQQHGSQVTGLLLFICLCISAGNLSASPATVSQKDGTSLALAGIGPYEQLNELIYLGALYLPDGANNPDSEHPSRLEMRIAIEEISARRFTRMWLDAITLSSTREQRDSLFEQIQFFSELYPLTLLKGDHVVFDYIADEQATYFYHNSIEAGVIPGGAFYLLLLQAWLGDTPKSTDLKQGLSDPQYISENIPDTRNLFISLGYDSQRHNQVANELEIERQQRLQALELEKQEELNRLLEDERKRQQEDIQARAAKQERQRYLDEQIKQEQQRLHVEEQHKLGVGYTNELTRWISQHMEYPNWARLRGLEGRVEVSITSDRSGFLLRKEIRESSEITMLDKTAEKIVENAEPLPAMPEMLEGESFTFTMPIVFVLND